MSFALVASIILASIVGIDILRRRNERGLNPVLESEYKRTKFIPTSVLLPLIAIGVVLAGSARRLMEIEPLLGLLLPVFLALTLLFIRILNERKFKGLGLPQEFIRRDRAYNLMTVAMLVTFSVVSTFFG